MKEVKITIPEGYEIDTECSTFECVRFKKKERVKVWKDIEKLSGAYITAMAQIKVCGPQVTSPLNIDIFLTEAHAKSAIAIAQISQLMPYYGGEISNEEWESCSLTKYCIVRKSGGLSVQTSHVLWQLLAFHTYEQAKSFFTNNKDLVEAYYML